MIPYDITRIDTLFLAGFKKKDNLKRKGSCSVVKSRITKAKMGRFVLMSYGGR